MHKILKHALVIMFFTSNNISNAQTTKVAILDFENTTGKTEYDALGKAISSMLITDLANNIHPKKVEFFERSQLNKLLDKQKLQKSRDFDAKTAVDFGKLSGVNYVFVGSVFVLDGTCNFSSKLVNVQTFQHHPFECGGQNLINRRLHLLHLGVLETKRRQRIKSQYA